LPDNHIVIDPMIEYFDIAETYGEKNMYEQKSEHKHCRV